MANRIVRLTESDLNRLVRRVIKESETEMNSNQLKTNITTMFTDFPTLMELLLDIMIYAPGKLLDVVRGILKCLNPFNYEAGPEEVYGFTADDHPQLKGNEIDKLKDLFSFRNVTGQQIKELSKEIHANRKEIIQKLKSLLK
jgi:hypothetical protein